MAWANCGTTKSVYFCQVYIQIEHKNSPVVHVITAVMYREADEVQLTNLNL